MLSYELLVSLIFRWLDLLVIAAGAIYGIKQWVIPFLKKEKKREQERLHDLEHKIVIHTQQVGELEKQMAQDKIHAAQLQQKVMLWQAVCAQERIAQKRYQEELVARLQDQNDLKNRYIAQLSYNKHIAQEAYAQAEFQIRETSKHHEVASKNLHNAIIHLKESVS